MSLYELLDILGRMVNRIIITPVKTVSLGGHGKKIHIGRRTRFYGIKNVFLGNDVSLGEQNTLMCTRARIKIGDHVMT